MAVKTNKAPKYDGNASDSYREIVGKAKKTVEKIGSPDLSKMTKTYNSELRMWTFK